MYQAPSTTPKIDNTEITLIERGLPHADPQTRIFSMEAWSSALEQLAEVMEEVLD